MRDLALSLRFRITVGVLIPLLAILSLFFYVRFSRYQRLLMYNLQLSAAHAGEIIEGSLQHAMLSNDLSTIQLIMDNIGQQPGVRDLFILDKQGRVVTSTDGAMTGKTMDITDATCQACHSHTVASRNESVILTFNSGSRVYRNVNAIETKPECASCHAGENPLLGVLISDFDLASIDRALAAEGRASFLWAVGSIFLALLIVNLMMSKLVIGRLEQLAKAMRRVDQGDLVAHVAVGSHDEIGVLGRAFNHMVEGLKEKRELEQNIQKQANKLEVQTEELAMLNDLAGTVSRSLNLQEILGSALDRVLESMGLQAGWVFLRNGDDDAFRLSATRGLGEHMDSELGRCVGEMCLERWGAPRGCDEGHENPCRVAQPLTEQGLVLRACVPLRSKDRVLGVMGLAGRVSAGTRGSAEDQVGTLAAIGRQIGMAVENASLYEALQEKEVLRRQLLGRIITAQEEERKRVARELHDQMSQPLSSLIMTLEVLEKPVVPEELAAHVQDMRDITLQMLEQVHDLALALRPSVLDDLGLLAALRQHFREVQDRTHLPVDFQALGFSSQRLPPAVETALYRIVQEALTNVARHAQAKNVGVLLEHKGATVLLMVEDDGKGFDVTQVMGSHPRASNLGLYGMQERAALLGGTLMMESSVGAGTALFVEIPLERGGNGHEQDTAAGG